MAMDFWLQGIEQQDVSVEFPEITLTRARDSKTYKGPGSVLRTASGGLALKLYSQFNFKEAFQFERSPAGTLVPKADLFDLEGVDMHGHRWLGDGISPDPNYSMGTGLAVVHADPYRLVGERPRMAGDKCYLSLAICTDAEFPINQKEQTERKIGQELLSARYSWSAAEFDADGLHFRIVREGDLLVVQVSGEWDAGAAEDLAGWVVSALQFTLGRRLFADVISLYGGDNRIQIVQSIDRERMRPKIQPPRHWKSGADAGSTWNIFAAFLRFLRNAPSVKAKELCRWSAEVVDSGGAALEVSSLVLSVAVEGVVGLLQGKESRDESLLKDVADALSVAAVADFPARLKPRIIGAIESMKRLRAGDYLKELARQEIIPAHYVDAWNGLRNWSTHADAADGEWVAPILRKADIVLALYYRLVFLLIEFRGPYTDYSQVGWPERNA
jgi:hypothetical protein